MAQEVIIRERSSSILIFSIGLLLLSVYGVITFEMPDLSQTNISNSSVTTQYTEDRAIPQIENGFTIGMWNIQIFGLTKWQNNTLREELLSVLTLFDVVIVQEVRDASNKVASELCAEFELSGYGCMYSVRAGRTSATEQYVFAYNSSLFSVGEVYDMAIRDGEVDFYEYWERPPLIVTLTHNDTQFRIATIHVRPLDAVSEIRYLDLLLGNATTDSFILIGDLNADCAYYNTNRETYFTNWYWVIAQGDDTTLSQRTCAYDRILLNDVAQGYFAYSYGILKEDITLAHSDHYPVWAGFSLS